MSNVQHNDGTKNELVEAIIQLTACLINLTRLLELQSRPTNDEPNWPAV